MSYNPDQINAAMGERRLTNDKVANLAGVAPKTVSAIRNGFSGVTLPTLIKIANAVGLDVEVRFKPMPAESGQIEEPAAA